MRDQPPSADFPRFARSSTLATSRPGADAVGSEALASDALQSSASDAARIGAPSLLSDAVGVLMLSSRPPLMLSPSLILSASLASDALQSPAPDAVRLCPLAAGSDFVRLSASDALQSSAVVRL